MKTICLALLALCAIGSTFSQDCSAKLKDFHKCIEDNDKKIEHGKVKLSVMKEKLDACYTDNGCTPPSPSQDDSKDSACTKAIEDAMQTKLEECVKNAAPGFELPPRKPAACPCYHMSMDDDKALEGCDKKQAVLACKDAVFNSSRLTEDEQKAIFQADCDGKQACEASLDAECQIELDKGMKAMCQCREQAHEEAERVRSTAKECRTRGKRGTKDRHSGHRMHDEGNGPCEKKDFCKLGYEAFMQSLQFGPR